MPIGCPWCRISSPAVAAVALGLMVRDADTANSQWLSPRTEVRVVHAVCAMFRMTAVHPVLAVHTVFPVFAVFTVFTVFTRSVAPVVFVVFERTQYSRDCCSWRGA